MNLRLLRQTFFIFPLLLTSCFTSSILQTAKPLDKGTCEFSGGILGFSRGETLPGLNTMLRVGIGRRSDIGLGYSLGIGHLRLDYKYNFYRSANEKNFLSTGLGFEYFFTEADYKPIPAISLPLYFSMNHTGKIIPYFAQRFTFGLADMNVAFGNHGEGHHTLFYTGGAGIRYGKNRLKGYVEVSYSVDRVRDRQLTQNADNEQYTSDHTHQSPGIEINVGLTFTFGGKKSEMHL